MDFGFARFLSGMVRWRTEDPLPLPLADQLAIADHPDIQDLSAKAGVFYARGLRVRRFV